MLGQTPHWHESQDGGGKRSASLTSGSPSFFGSADHDFDLASRFFKRSTRSLYFASRVLNFSARELILALSREELTDPTTNFGP